MINIQRDSYRLEGTGNVCRQIKPIVYVMQLGTMSHPTENMMLWYGSQNKQRNKDGYFKHPNSGVTVKTGNDTEWTQEMSQIKQNSKLAYAEVNI